MTATAYLKTIIEQLNSFDKKAAEGTCEKLINYLYSTDEPVERKESETIMQQLRNKRMFGMMLRLGDAYLQTSRDTYKLRKLYAQALIDLNLLTAAISTLMELIADTETNVGDDASASIENTEAKGLLGR